MRRGRGRPRATSARRRRTRDPPCWPTAPAGRCAWAPPRPRTSRISTPALDAERVDDPPRGLSPRIIDRRRPRPAAVSLASSEAGRRCSQEGAVAQIGHHARGRPSDGVGERGRDPVAALEADVAGEDYDDHALALAPRSRRPSEAARPARSLSAVIITTPPRRSAGVRADNDLRPLPPGRRSKEVPDPPARRKGAAGPALPCRPDGSPRGERPETLHCYRHPDRETLLSCSDCERPICTSCMTQPAVGVRCPECAGGKRRAATPRPVGARVTRTTVATTTLVAINVLVFLAEMAQGVAVRGVGGSELVDDGAIYGPAVADGEWWRLVTGGFLRAGLIHLAFNMYLLWILGGALRRYAGAGAVPGHLLHRPAVGLGGGVTDVARLAPWAPQGGLRPDGGPLPARAPEGHRAARRVSAGRSSR